MFTGFLFIPFAFVMESIGEVLGHGIGYLTITNSHISITRNLVAPVTSLGCFVVFFNSFVPNLGNQTVYLNQNSTSLNSTDSNSTQSNSTGSNNTETFGMLQPEDLEKRIIPYLPESEGSGVPDVVYLSTCCLLGLLNGFWSITQPIEEYGYDWQDSVN